MPKDITEARARYFARRLDKHRERILTILKQIEQFEGPLRDEIIESIQDNMLDLLAHYTCVIDGSIKTWMDSPIPYVLANRNAKDKAEKEAAKRGAQ